MNDQFYRELFQQQQQKEAVPSNEAITSWAEELIAVLYPQFSAAIFTSEQSVRDAFDRLQSDFLQILNTTAACSHCNNQQVSTSFFEQVPAIYRLLNTDVMAIVEGDPAAHSRFEVVRAYPGFFALCFYRIAHALHQLEVPLLPRILTEQAHSKTGIDIHPAAEIGEYFCIDHGTGIVIGETANVGRHVKLYQGVTLGALSVNKDLAFTKRHPTVEDHVVIYSGATILGGDTVIGHHSVIGGNVWLTRSVPPGSLVFHNPEITVVEGKLLTT
jgi:serine O-acetyltransferase